MNIASIVLENTNNPNIVKSLTDYKDESIKESYFYETIKFCESLQEDYNSINKKFYRGILESGDSEVVIMEVFDELFDKIKSIINKIIEFIKKIWNKFIAAINKFIGNKAYLKKHLDELRNFSSENEFEYEGFTYTISPAIPVNNVVKDLFDDTKIDLKESDILNGKYEEIDSKYEALKNELDNSWYDKARGQVLGTSDNIYEENYADELFEIFRDGDDEKHTFDVTTSIIADCTSAFKNYERLKSDTEKTKNRIEKEYKNISDDYEKTISHVKDSTYKFKYKNFDNKDLKFNGGSDNNNIKNILDQYAKLKAMQVQRLSNIHLLAFSAKLDALKDQEKQSVYILYKALYKVKGKKVPNERG